MKLGIETKLEKFGGPLKNLCGPPEGRGPPVEKHWSRGPMKVIKVKLFVTNGIF